MKRFALLTIMLGVILVQYSCTSCKEKVHKQNLVVVVPVVIDAINDFLKGVETNLDTSQITFSFLSAEGDPTRFETVIKTALMKKPDMLVVFGSQMSDLAVSSKFINSLPPTILSALSDPSKITGLSDIGVNPPRKKKIGVVGDTPEVSYYVVCRELLESTIGKGKTVGIIYTKSDLNAEITAKELSDELRKANFKIEFGISNSVDDVSDVTKTLLLKGVNAIVLPHDKNILVATPSIVKLAYEYKKVPIFSLDEGTVREKGVIASASVSYSDVGKMTADLAKDVLLNKKEISDLPVIKANRANMYINKTNAKKFNIAISPELMKNAIIFE